MNARASSRLMHLVALHLDPVTFPDRSAFVDVLSRLAILGPLECIEIAIAPEGGGHLAFVLQRDCPSETVRAELRELVGEDAILDCRARPF